MGTLLKDRMALLKGHLSLEEATNWPESPEQATERYCSFFGKWFALGAPSKPEIRLACSEAWPKLSSQSLKGLVNGLQECRTHLKRKWNNMKTGDRTSKELRDLMHNMFGQAGSSSQKIVCADKPEKATPVLPTKRASKLKKATPEPVASSDEAKPGLEKEKLVKWLQDFKASSSRNQLKVRVMALKQVKPSLKIPMSLQCRLWHQYLPAN